MGYSPRPRAGQAGTTLIHPPSCLAGHFAFWVILPFHKARPRAVQFIYKRPLNVLTGPMSCREMSRPTEETSHPRAGPISPSRHLPTLARLSVDRRIIRYNTHKGKGARTEKKSVIQSISLSA